MIRFMTIFAFELSFDLYNIYLNIFCYLDIEKKLYLCHNSTKKSFF